MKLVFIQVLQVFDECCIPTQSRFWLRDRADMNFCWLLFYDRLFPHAIFSILMIGTRFLFRWISFLLYNSMGSYDFLSCSHSSVRLQDQSLFWYRASTIVVCAQITCLFITFVCFSYRFAATNSYDCIWENFSLLTKFWEIWKFNSLPNFLASLPALWGLTFSKYRCLCESKVHVWIPGQSIVINAEIVCL